MPFLAGSLYQISPWPLQQLTIDKDVNPLELSQCLIHCCRDGLGLPDINGQRQALLACGCHQLFGGLQNRKRLEILSGTLFFSRG